MEIEHINDDTIRVVIGNSDLEERGITFLDLLGNQKQIEKFFYSILEEVDIDEEFQESEAVTFQVMPNNNGLELFISKGNNFQDELSDLDLKNHTNPLKQNNNLLDEMEENANNDLQVKQAVVALEDFEHAIQLSKSLYMESGLSNLYLLDDQYYLQLSFFVEEMHGRTSEEEIAIALEYGSKSDMTYDVLDEYGKLLMDSNALETLRYYFK